jgi:murein DD-endopeptidase MepM/ murein hydrolase activator NlpD
VRSPWLDPVASAVDVPVAGALAGDTVQPAPVASASGAVGARVAVVAVGRRFQPLPGTPPVRSDPAGAVLIAPPGTPVHAVGAGVVLRPSDGVLRLRTDDGLDLGYVGMAPDSITAIDGDRVPAGAVLGLLADSVTGSTRLLLDVRDAAGAVVDPAGMLLGLPDPYELGSAAAGDGLGIDPDALDRALEAAAVSNAGVVAP